MRFPRPAGGERRRSRQAQAWILRGAGGDVDMVPGDDPKRKIKLPKDPRKTACNFPHLNQSGCLFTFNPAFGLKFLAPRGAGGGGGAAGGFHAFYGGGGEYEEEEAGWENCG